MVSGPPAGEGDLPQGAARPQTEGHRQCSGDGLLAQHSVGAGQAPYDVGRVRCGGDGRVGSCAERIGREGGAAGLRRPRIRRGPVDGAAARVAEGRTAEPGRGGVEHRRTAYDGAGRPVPEAQCLGQPGAQLVGRGSQDRHPVCLVVASDGAGTAQGAQARRVLLPQL